MNKINNQIWFFFLNTYNRYEFYDTQMPSLSFHMLFLDHAIILYF